MDTQLQGVKRPKSGRWVSNSEENLNAPRAEKLPEIGQHTLREPKNVAEALHRVGSAFKCEEVRVWRRCHIIKFCAKLARKNCKISGNPARRAHKNCVHSASNRCACCKTSAEVFRIDNAFHYEKARVRRRDHANVAPKSRERIAKFLKKFGAPRAQKVSCTRLACAATRMTSSKLFTKS